MTRRVIPIDEKIEKQTAEVMKLKKKYDQEVSILNALLEKKKDQESKELLEAFRNSRRSCKEVLEFLQTG